MPNQQPMSLFEPGRTLVILFAPTASNEAYIDQWQALYPHVSALEAARTRIMSIFEDEIGDNDGDPVDEAAAQAIRRQFRVKRGYTMTLVIDGDGKTHKLQMPADYAAIAQLFKSD